MAKLLLVENEQATLRLMAKLLEAQSHEVTQSTTGEEASEHLANQSFDLMLTDLRMSGMDGMELLSKAHKAYPDMPIVMLTAFGTVNTAVEALKLGAFDYLSKPFKIDEFMDVIKRALDYGQTIKNSATQQDNEESYLELENLIAASPAMKKVCEMIRRVAPLDSPVLISGEPGSGKDGVANAIHACSNRSDGPFLSVNCTAFPDDELEVELFGYGAGYEGAIEDHEGLIESVAGGTFVIEEISALPLTGQDRLLNLLKDGNLRRCGSREEIPLDVRVIASTSDNLKLRVTEGHFRSDLFARLSLIPIALEPLRKRKQDIVPIAATLLRRNQPENAKPVQLSRDVTRLLEAYNWPGNVRELEEIIKYAERAADGQAIKSSHLPSRVTSNGAGSGASFLSREDEQSGRGLSLKAFLRKQEKVYMEKVLAKTGGDKKAAAEKMRMTESQLIRKLPPEDT